MLVTEEHLDAAIAALKTDTICESCILAQAFGGYVAKRPPNNDWSQPLKHSLVERGSSDVLEVVKPFDKNGRDLATAFDKESYHSDFSTVREMLPLEVNLE